MAQDDDPVNRRKQLARPRYLIVVVRERCKTWVDQHPRTGWYIMILLALNYILDAVQSLF